MSYYRDKTKTEAFAEFGAKTRNKMNEYSAEAEDGSIVLECWNQYILPLPDGTWRYQLEDLSSWTNIHGRDLMLEHLRIAFAEDRPIRLIIAKLKRNPNADVGGMDGANEPKTIITYNNRIGRVISVDTDRVIVDFRKQVAA